MPAKTSASNSVQKACAVLRALSVRAPLRLTDVSRLAALNKVTTLRLLDVLVDEGYVRRIDAEKRYALGPEALAMAAATRRASNLYEAVRPSLIRLADMSEDTALLSIRSGNEAVCIDRRVGSFPIQANYLDVGSRRPLGVGAGSMALLAWLDEREIEAVVGAISPQLAPYSRLTAASLREQSAIARGRGYTLVVDVIVERMGGIGVPILAPGGDPLGALSIAALSERIGARREALVTALRREAARIVAELV